MSAVWAAVLQLLPGKTALSESGLAALYQYQDEISLARLSNNDFIGFMRGFDKDVIYQGIKS
ncbi:hypothetical protein [Erwinia piriflorinigrans]|uniref:Uncharacterized protein n=1 Tax=Erwinia piriflorinigrans CFBP 5888 TaxID=1161919 RepID=V5ZCM3_9GAMM|nr:hypothetical protein [Erwinia piriflorinigrans]CCG88990.1 hypothetical protein EPIR_3627 [Erwinia piriflorinigrans CFBP 5888]